MFGLKIIKKKEFEQLKSGNNTALSLLDENLKLSRKIEELEKYVPNRNAQGKFCKKQQ